MKPVEESSPRGKDWLVLNLNTKKVQYFKKYDDASKHVKKKGGIIMTSAHYEDNKGLYESENTTMEITEKAKAFLNRESNLEEKTMEVAEESTPVEEVELEESTDIWSKDGITLTRFAGGKDLGVLFQLSQERSIGDKKYSSSYIVLTPDQVKGLFGTKIRGSDYKMK